MNKRKTAAIALGLIAAGATGTVVAQDFIPIPGEPEQPATTNPIQDLTTKAISATGGVFTPSVPESMTIENEGGEITYDNDTHSITYMSGKKPVRLRTDSGIDIQAKRIRVNLEKKTAALDGPLTVYLGETLTLAEGGTYDWEHMVVDIQGVRAKVSGVIVKGARVEYKTDDKGKQFMRIHDAYVSTDDSQKPGTWIGAGQLTVYPGEYGTVTRLSVASGDYDVAIPIIGWFTFSHSLNPREGYLPHPGVKSIWGTYLLNQYGILFGNKRVENNIPTADYLMMNHVDYRSRRGLAVGIDLEDIRMSKKYRDMQGLRTYYAADSDPMINPTDIPREHTRHNRYSLKLTSLWELPATWEQGSDWTLGANINALSDQYMLRDYFEDEGHVDDKPDNTVRLVRRNQRSETMLLTRFSPNDFYMTDERIELSYYRARTGIGNTGLSYETRNSFGMIRQDVPPQEWFRYRAELNATRDPAVRNYYERLLNTSHYLRANSTHELTANYKAFGFLNITPKAGVGYSGYYGVDDVGADNRFLGYLGADISFKLHKSMPNFSMPSLGYKGLTHVIRPYTTLSYCNISSSSPLVPQVNTWSSLYGTSTSSPMNLDLMGFTGIDSWGTWSIMRFGVQNTLTTHVDGEPATLLNWNVFFDYNEENPNTNSEFSNLYSQLSLHPTRRLQLYLETQTPTINSGDGFSQYNASLVMQPTASLETIIGYRCIDNHPILEDAEQVYAQANLRINEQYSVACRWNWDITEGTLPIQQYSLFRKSGAWYLGATLFLRDNGGKRETGFGISFTLGETGSSLPIDFF